MYKYYLLAAPETEKRAFIAGLRTMMDIIKHTPPDDHSVLLSRDDPDWILYICESNQQRRNEERRAVAETVLRNYTVDKNSLRGMIFDCERLDDDGLPIDGEGNPTEKRPYPNKRYENIDGDEISLEEYESLPFDQQCRCTVTPYIELRGRNNASTRKVPSYSAIFEALLRRELIEEPLAMLKLYREALEKGENDLIHEHKDIFKEAINYSLFTRGVQDWLGTSNDGDNGDDSSAYAEEES